LLAKAAPTPLTARAPAITGIAILSFLSILVTLLFSCDTSILAGEYEGRMKTVYRVSEELMKVYPLRIAGHISGEY
jgi:hypothetical protein